MCIKWLYVSRLIYGWKVWKMTARKFVNLSCVFDYTTKIFLAYRNDLHWLFEERWERLFNQSLAVFILYFRKDRFTQTNASYFRTCSILTCQMTTFIQTLLSPYSTSHWNSFWLLFWNKSIVIKLQNWSVYFIFIYFVCWFDHSLFRRWSLEVIIISTLIMCGVSVHRVTQSSVTN